MDLQEKDQLNIIYSKNMGNTVPKLHWFPNNYELEK